MKKEQINNILINIATVAIGLGVLIFGYFSFVSKDKVVTDSVAIVAEIAENTTSVGADIDNTVRTLDDLSRAVALSTVLFELPSFKSLQNFTVQVLSEKVGRENPFVPAEWKLKMKNLEASVKSSVSIPSTTEDTAPSALEGDKQTKAKPDASSALFGEFAPGI